MVTKEGSYDSVIVDRPKYTSLLQSVALLSNAWPAAVHLLGRPVQIPLRMEMFIWNNRVKNELLHGVKEDRNTLQIVK